MTNKDPFSLAQHIKGVRIRDLVGFAKLGITFLPGMVVRRMHPHIWVISEYEDDARDNGYWFFKYLRENHPEQEAYYPIHKASSDYHKVADFGNVVEYGSLKHYVLFWAASIYAGSTKLHGFPSILACDFLHLRGFTFFRYVFLNHGVARGYSEITDGARTNYALLIAISEQERRTIVAMNNQPENKVAAIGFCRHDNLDGQLLDPNLVLYMPTWRRWVDIKHVRNKRELEQAKERYLSSDYYKRCQALIQDPKLIQYLESNDLRFVVYLHEFAQPYSVYLTPGSDRIVIADKDHYFVQDLLKRAAYLVTDYSSVVFDFAYMKKPCCYYQYDSETFAKEQYAESEFFTYERDGFGPIFNKQEDVVDHIIDSHKRGFAMDSPYRERVEHYFPSFDKLHCAKTYELVRSLDK